MADDKITRELRQQQIQAALVRDSLTGFVQRELMYNPNPNWPMLLQRLNVSISQLSNLADSIDPVLQYWTVYPYLPTTNPSDIPLFLGTRPLADMESEERALMSSSLGDHPQKPLEEEEAHKTDEDIIQEYNSKIESAERAIDNMAVQLMKKIKKETRIAASQRS